MKKPIVPPIPDLINQLSKRSLDFHCHGVGRFDFTEIFELDLQEIEEILSKRKQQTILTLYLLKPNFEHFLDLMNIFDEGRRAGKYNHLLGFALEGPLLASHGGIPKKSVWMPNEQQWKKLANCGKKGLIYIILSPDAFLSGNNFSQENKSLSITWIVETLLEGGVLPAPGHFLKSNPATSAEALQSIFNVVGAWGKCPTITDHLYNDMPRNFKHAWRTPEEKAKRDQEIKSLKIENWNLDSIKENLGLIPAIMIQNARKGIVKICQNFDGEHVDLAIVKKTVELVGAENMMMMTDSIESKKLAGRKLQMHEGSTLLYQDEGIVAAGTQGSYRQIENMFSIGLNLNQVELLTHKVAASLLQRRNDYIDRHSHAEADCS